MYKPYFKERFIRLEAADGQPNPIKADLDTNLLPLTRPSAFFLFVHLSQRYQRDTQWSFLKPQPPAKLAASLLTNIFHSHLGLGVFASESRIIFTM